MGAVSHFADSDAARAAFHAKAYQAPPYHHTHTHTTRQNRMDSAAPPTLASSIGLGAALFQHHLASFLDRRSRAALASTCRRLHYAAAPDSYSTACIDDWRFLACFVGQGAARPLRWRCWLPDARTERLFLHAALSRYEDKSSGRRQGIRDR